MRKKSSNSNKALEELENVVARLRGPGGCPWDRQQNHRTLAPFAIEETYELVEALETNDTNSIIEELGDVLFQVVLHAQLLKEKKRGDLREILNLLTEKMIRRHPHVFGTAKAATTREVLKQWDQIKQREKQNAPRSKQFLIPKKLPALQRAQKIGDKTRKEKFDWSHPNEVFKKLDEELQELRIAYRSESKARLKEEFGDVLFTLVQLGRHLNLEVEGTLRKANLKFEKRFFAMQALHEKKKKDLSFENLSLDAKEHLWTLVKRRERKTSPKGRKLK